MGSCCLSPLAPDNRPLIRNVSFDMPRICHSTPEALHSLAITNPRGFTLNEHQSFSDCPGNIVMLTLFRQR